MRWIFSLALSACISNFGQESFPFFLCIVLSSCFFLVFCFSYVVDETLISMGDEWWSVLPFENSVFFSYASDPYTDKFVITESRCRIVKSVVERGRCDVGYLENGLDDSTTYMRDLCDRNGYLSYTHVEEKSCKTFPGWFVGGTRSTNPRRCHHQGYVGNDDQWQRFG